MKKLYKILSVLILAAIFTSCVNDLDVVPIDPDDKTTASLYDDPGAYRQLLAKMYAGLATTGQQGPAGQADIAGIDEGTSSYLRMYWYHQELTTDEAVIAWNDQTVKDFHSQTWGEGDVFIQALYSRLYYQITFANEFLRETSASKLSDRGVTGALASEVGVYRAETRLLRAMSYLHILDLFGGDVPFVVEANGIGAFLPEPTNSNDLFNYIESELLAIETELAAPRTNEYGRVDAASAWMLLSKLYLNAQVYVGTDKYTECVTYSKKVIDAGYQLSPDYAANFRADNHQSPELIFAVAYHGNNTQTFGGTTFLVHAAVGGNMAPGDFGIDGGWGGIRTTSALVNKFSDTSGDTDSRAMFHTDGQTLEIADIGVFTDGYAITKYSNLDVSGAAGVNLTHVDVDYPLFRLADAYLMYAEAILRGGAGGSATEALGYVNEMRERAYGDASGNVSAVDMNLDFVLDERARELYWEGHRRTDLIRYGRFSDSDYLWPWKGGAPAGASVSATRDLFPIPSTDLSANPNLKQNDGY